MCPRLFFHAEMLASVCATGSKLGFSYLTLANLTCDTTAIIRLRLDGSRRAPLSYNPTIPPRWRRSRAGRARRQGHADGHTQRVAVGVCERFTSAKAG
jgi:hypothetical protein